MVQGEKSEGYGSLSLSLSQPAVVPGAGVLQVFSHFRLGLSVKINVLSCTRADHPRPAMTASDN